MWLKNSKKPEDTDELSVQRLARRTIQGLGSHIKEFLFH
jgi:hypothetical protein